MSTDARIEKITKMIADLIADERADERQKTIEGIMRSVGGEGTTIGPLSVAPARVTRHPDAGKLVRAPAGSARVLCQRALGEAKASGLTIKKIHEQAQGEYEKMLSTSALRNELHVGSTMATPLYKQVGGVWYLAECAPPSMRIVS